MAEMRWSGEIVAVEPDYLENVQVICAKTTGGRLWLRMPSAVDHNMVGDKIELVLADSDDG